MQPKHKRSLIGSRAISCLMFTALLLLQTICASAAGDEGVTTDQSGIPLRGQIQELDNADPNHPVISNPLGVAGFSVAQIATDNVPKKISNVIMLSLNEESKKYLSADFSIDVKVKIAYGHDANSFNSFEKILTIGYSRNNGATYNPRNYVKMEGWEYVKVTVLEPATFPVIGTVDSRDLLTLENQMQVTRYYTLNGTLAPVAGQYFFDAPAAGADECTVHWAWTAGTGNNYTQLEWTWIEDEMQSYYPDNESRFRNNATRIDLRYDVHSYNIPLLYDGAGKLYFRIRAVNLKSNGSRVDGQWFYTNPGYCSFGGHNNNLNWQVTTTFAEDGKRKSVIQYYDGSLRSRQTVTKDNTTNTTVTAETIYDGQGRPAIQVLPTPGISNVIAYTQGLNLFNGPATGDAAQTLTDNPADFFDLQPANSTSSTTPSLQTSSGASRYYSTQNTEKTSGFNDKITDAAGYPYTVTRYTPDATGRIESQSGVGDAFKMNSGHETKYYYGTPSQEELDGLFGTEVGDFTHYFKNMVKDANGQMSVSYVDMHGRTIATALAGKSPDQLQALDITNNDHYYGQTEKLMTQDLLNGNANIAKNNSIESINTLLVPEREDYHFTYSLDPGSLSLATCKPTNICYDCLYDLEISVTDESGVEPPKIRQFSNVSIGTDNACSNPAFAIVSGNATIVDNTITFTEPLEAGSYIVRKTLTISEASLAKFKELYAAQLEADSCDAQKKIFDSVYAALQLETGCNVPNKPTDGETICASCAAISTYEGFRADYVAGLNPVPAEDAIRRAYNEHLELCKKLCSVNTSHSLDMLREAMIADMVPYSGQYALNPLADPDPGTEDDTYYNAIGLAIVRGTMYNNYDIFASGHFRNPKDENGPNAPLNGSYKDDYGQADPTITPVLSTITPDDFQKIYKNSWSISLLPHHPEYEKLQWAEQNLAQSYNWIDNLMQVTTYQQAAAAGYTTDITDHDQFFIDYPNAGSPNYKSDLQIKITSNYQQNLSMWQIAYANEKCKMLTDKNARTQCYADAPKTPANDQTGLYNALTTEEKDKVWNSFKAMYYTERNSKINEFINTQKPLSNDQALIDDHYLLHFPKTNEQAAAQYQWSWYPPTAPYVGEELPGISLKDSVEAYENGHCLAYVDGWRKTLETCPTLEGNPNRDTIISKIIRRMLAVCQQATDPANPNGASTLPDNTVSALGDKSFEQVFTDVFKEYGLQKTVVCSPYMIEYPKPYDKGRRLTQEYTVQIDTCECRQYAKIVADAGQSGGNLASLNEYLRGKYQDTLTPALYEGLQHCSELGVVNCPDTTTSCGPGTAVDTLVVNTRSGNTPAEYLARLTIHFTTGFISGGNDVFKAIIDANLQPCTQGGGTNTFAAFAVCDDCVSPPPTAGCDTALYYYPLVNPQPLPQFLTCGFTDENRCVTCNVLRDYTKAFTDSFPQHQPVFTGDNLDSAQLTDNVAYAQFINYHTGFQYTWIEYVHNLASAECDINGSEVNGDVDVICGKTQPLTDITGLLIRQDPCQRAFSMAQYIAQGLYEQRRAEKLAAFEAAFRVKCMDAQKDENFTVAYNNKEYHYTLYYYDMAGNLVKTVPPKGVHPKFQKIYTDSVETYRKDGLHLPQLPQHSFITQYRYNSLNQVVAQQTPDAGTSLFWYDRLGRLVVSQNAKQYTAHNYSYTVYDALGRITEVGQKPQTMAMTQAISQDNKKDDGTNTINDLLKWLFVDGGVREQITTTVYDDPYHAVQGLQFDQHNLRNRVSYTKITNLATDGPLGFTSATYYTYDVHGNVDTLVQDYGNADAAHNTMNYFNNDKSGNRFKKIVYRYDLISGKVNYVIYQPGVVDAFYHHYLYDAENRLTDVMTSRDSIYWERDASYQYYKHGPLARTVLGQQQVQGLDYVYTLQGWLKAINPGVLATGGAGGSCGANTAQRIVNVNTRNSGTVVGEYKAIEQVNFEEGFGNGNDDYFDALVDPNLSECTASNEEQPNVPPDGSEGSVVAQDAYNVLLNYYDNDYNGIAFTSPSTGIASGLGADFRPLYNGNISSMGVNVGKLGQAFVYNYKYDQLNRLVQMDAFASSGASWGNLEKKQDFAEAISYDANGNIDSYHRNGNNTYAGKPLGMDDLSYHYKTDKNQLDYIHDEVADGNYTEDIDNQSAGNYTYDEIGDLIKDKAEKIDQIEWTVYGKISKIVKSDDYNTVITYGYDATGNRIRKSVTKGTQTTDTWYVRDASGNVMSVYEAGNSAVNSGHLTQTEVDLYGNSRLGVEKPNVDVAAPIVNEIATLSDGSKAYNYIFTRGNKFFELSNHLDNALATVSDKKIAVDYTSDGEIDYYNADVVSASDYAPFGSHLVGRVDSSDLYRYGFNGKENDNEVKGNGIQQDYGMRIYDGRLGRFLSADPLQKNFPWNSPYSFAENEPITHIDLDGGEVRENRYAEANRFIEPSRYQGRQTYTSQSRFTNQSRFIPPSIYNSPVRSSNIYEEPDPLNSRHEGIIGPFIRIGANTRGVQMLNTFANMWDSREEIVSLLKGAVNLLETTNTFMSDGAIVTQQTKPMLVSVTFNTVEARQAFDLLQSTWETKKREIEQKYAVIPLNAPYTKGRNCIPCTEEIIPSDQVTEEMKQKRQQLNINNTVLKNFALLKLGPSPSQLLVEEVSTAKKGEFQVHVESSPSPEVKASSNE